MNRYRYRGFAPYVSVAKRRQQATAMIAALKKKGQKLNPMLMEGRTIAHTFWGKAWCKHLASFSDYENRLPRGRSYLRNGSVLDLQLHAGKIEALVNGASLYKVAITLEPIQILRWKKLINACSGKIDSLIELLRGKFSKALMEIITDRKHGLFPQASELRFTCSCPDKAEMCKHIAAVLYGVGARLDQEPEALFLLRKADHTELIDQASTQSLVKKSKKKSTDTLADQDLSDIFGIHIPAKTLAKSPKKSPQSQKLGSS
jgi:uncharacterized Zn finger protein